MLYEVITVRDLTGTHPDETFFRAFPEWRAVTSLDWMMNRFTGTLRVRWVDSIVITSYSIHYTKLYDVFVIERNGT